MQTNLEEWRGVATGSQPAWEPRARIIAKLIRSTDTVLDIGAGDQKLRRFIPPTCKYVPVDCVGDLPGTFVVDLNKEFRLPDVAYSVAVCAGFLEYLNDIAGFFRNLASHSPGRQVIFTYLLNEERSRREVMKVHNHFESVDELIAHTRFAFSAVDIVCIHQDSVFISATLSAGDKDQWINRHSITDLLQPRPDSPRGVRKLLRKTGRSISKRLIKRG